MATHDYVIDNSTGANVRADINNVLQAVLTNNSNSSSPSTTAAYMFWVDTTANIVKIRNSSNNAWINLFTTAGGVDVDAASNFNEDVTFTGASANIVFDKSDSQLEFADNAKAEFGTGGDFEIFHNGTASLIKSPSHTLFIQATTIDIGNGAGNEAKAKLIDNGAVELYYDNSKKFETDSLGTLVQGRMLFGDSGNVNDHRLKFGDSGDLQIYHNGTHNYIDTLSNKIHLRVNNGENAIVANSNGAVELYQDNVLRLSTETTGTRVNVAGNSGLRLDGTVADVDPRIVFRRHANDGNNSEPAAIQMTYVAGGTHESGHLDFQTNGDSGSAGLTTKMRIRNDGVLMIAQTSTASPGQGNTTAGIALNTSGRGNFSGTNTAAMLIQRSNDGIAQLLYRGGVLQGNISVSSSGITFNSTSDYRLKENVVAISDGITRLKTLKPSRFNFKSDKDTTVDGFLAHEVTTVPEAIKGIKDAVAVQSDVDEGVAAKIGDPVYQTIDQSKLVPLLVAAVQELITKVETLEAA